jgi:Sec-independent protein translocase protein TatA
VGLGTELLLVLLLGFLILGPKQMHALLARAAPVKAEFDKATRSFKSHLTAKPEIPSPTRETPSAKAVDVAARTASISPI